MLTVWTLYITLTWYGGMTVTARTATDGRSEAACILVGEAWQRQPDPTVRKSYECRKETGL